MINLGLIFHYAPDKLPIALNRAGLSECQVRTGRNKDIQLPHKAGAEACLTLTEANLSHGGGQADTQLKTGDIMHFLTAMVSSTVKTAGSEIIPPPLFE